MLVVLLALLTLQSIVAEPLNDETIQEAVEEEEAPASVKYGNQKLTIVGVSDVARRGQSATLTCTFGKLEGQMEILWTDSDGAKVGVYGYHSKDAYTQKTDDFVEETNSQTGILIIHDHKVVSTTFFKCEVGAGAVDSRRLPSPLRVDLRVYDIEGHNRVAIENTDVVLKCSFLYITAKPAEVFWIAKEAKYCSQIQGDEAGTCTGGTLDDPSARGAQHVYLVDVENSGFELYTPTSRALASTLTVKGAENTEDRTYTCGIKLPDEEDEWTLTLSVDVIGVERSHKEVRSYTELQLDCLFKDMDKQLEVYWSQGKGGEKLNTQSESNLIVGESFDAFQRRQRCYLIIPAKYNEFSTDYFCSIYDIDTYRDTKITVGVFHVVTAPQTVEAGVNVTFTVSLSSLKYPVRVRWRNSNGMFYDELTMANYHVDDGERDPVSQTQTAILKIPGEFNTGSLTLTCIITPDPCEIGYTQHQRYNDTSGGDTSGGDTKSTCNETLVEGVQRDIIPGIVDVVLNELANSGTQCSVDTIRSLMKESFSDSSPGNLAKPCFSIMEKGSGSKYGVDSTQKYVSPGNNLEIKPLPIYSAAFGESTVYRCTNTGWDKNPPGCGSAPVTNSVPAGACSTKNLFHPKYYKVESGFEVPDPDFSTSATPDVYYTHVQNTTVVRYSIRNSDCYQFDFTADHVTKYGDANDSVVRQTTFETTCDSGTFDRPVIPVKRVCCTYPTFKYEGAEGAEFCVKGVVDPPTADKGASDGVDSLTGEKYLKNGRHVYFDKRCPCFSVTWDNATCHEDKLLSTTWDIPADLRPTDASKIVNVTGREQMVLDSLFKIESFCCKIPQNQQDEGHPVNDVPSVRYLYRGKNVTYRCTGHCFRIKQKLRQATCTSTTPVLESPKCEPDPSCCPELEERNPFIEKLGNITWPKTANGKKHELKIGNMTITRRCYFSEWDLVRYKGVETNTLALQWKINGTDEICGKTLPGSDFTYSSESNSNEAAESTKCAVPTIKDGTVTPTSPISPGASFSVECSAGFTLTGDETVSCTDVQGQATLGQLPSCVQQAADSTKCAVPTIKDGTVTPTSPISPGATFSVECSAGFTLTGDETVSCTDDQGQATLGQLPSCVQQKRKKRDAGANQSDTSDGAQTDTTTGGETETSGASETAGGAAETSGVTGNTTACIPTSSAPDALLGLEDENCTVLEKMLSVNLSVEHTVAALDRLHDYTFNITDKAERTTCYNALRYILLDPWNFGYRTNLDTVDKNRLIVTAAYIINSWVFTVSENLKRAFSYAAIKVKTNAAAKTSSAHIYDGWMIQMSANRYVQNSFMWSMQGLLFPPAPLSDVISPITWVDLPNNSTIPGETQYIEVNFTSSRPLTSSDKLTLAERQDWTRGSCVNFTTQYEHQSVICRCSSWKMFLAVTETRNYTDGLFGNYTVGDAASPTMLYANQTLDIVAMVTLAAVFVLIIKASTRRQPLMQCRMQICFAMVGSHLLSLLTSYMTPANISCVYMVYIFEIFVLATIIWFSMEFICLRNVIRGMDDPDLKPSKKFSFKMIPVVYIAAFIVPSVFITYYKHASTDGALTFVQTFDAQSCWFNQDLELILFTAPVFGFILLGIIMYFLPLVTCFLNKRNCGIDVVSSGIMFLNVVGCWILHAFRADPYIQYCGRALFAAQGVVGLMCYVWLTPDVKTSLFPGCFPSGEEEDKQKLVGHG